MSDLPILVMDAGAFPNLAIRVDGDLPTVTDMTDDEHAEAVRWRDWQSIELAQRSLSAGDRVTLATECRCDFGGRTRGEPHEVPFATATVAKITRTVHVSGKNRYFVTVTDVEET